jgi:hypothetical protein
MINITDATYNEPPQLITDCLIFLPETFKEISGIYQRTSGEVVIFVENQYYMINFPSLSFVTGYPKYIGELGIARGNTINAVVTTYIGTTFLLYNNNYYMEIDECLMRAKNYGMISKLFPGLLPSINSAFRFTNGNFYFSRTRYFTSLVNLTTQSLEPLKQPIIIWN